MRKRIQAAVVPAVMVAAVAGAAGHRAQDSGPGRRLDELSKERPAAATHFPVDGALAAASQAAETRRWVDRTEERRVRFGRAAAENEALQDKQDKSRQAPARP